MTLTFLVSWDTIARTQPKTCKMILKTSIVGERLIDRCRRRKGMERAAVLPRLHRLPRCHAREQGLLSHTPGAGGLSYIGGLLAKERQAAASRLRSLREPGTGSRRLSRWVDGEYACFREKQTRTTLAKRSKRCARGDGGFRVRGRGCHHHHRIMVQYSWSSLIFSPDETTGRVTTSRRKRFKATYLLRQINTTFWIYPPRQWKD